jgi:hypothetical protein
LTEFLCDHLNSAAYQSGAWNHIQFRTETVDEIQRGRKIDLTVKPRGGSIVIEGRRHSQFDSLFPIECKRLPTPKGVDRDEREYVCTKKGNTGGIQRFKCGYHGASHNFGGMIGFIQEKDARYWEATVNNWIKDLAAEPESAWSTEDMLQFSENEPSSPVRILESRHGRPKNLPVCELLHLWISVTR